jgi:rhodanese-related sulfurtransferase
VIASSILQAKGFQNIVNIIGGFKALSGTNLPKSEYLLQKSML